MIDTNNKNKQIPIYHKLNLTINEAAEYSNIGINKLSELVRDYGNEFTLYVGKKKLIKRKEFEEFISNQLEI